MQIVLQQIMTRTLLFRDGMRAKGQMIKIQDMNNLSFCDGLYYAHSDSTAYFFDQNLHIQAQKPSPIKTRCVFPWNTECVMFNDNCYSCDSGKLYLFRGLDAVYICDLPEIHSH